MRLQTVCPSWKRRVVESICRRLEKAQRVSEHHEEFEAAVCEAFSFLGVDAEHIGGAGDTDVLLKTQDALVFLGSRAVGILQEVPGSGEACCLAMSPETARRRLSALAEAFGSTTEFVE
ncbi:MAG: hypothetical protein M1370_07650 [Bacteroidetes bacterium]|nr:hypothetical protein [Bacteroidota bacterium]MCL5026254.1 hypothetical protein [Chloroflexota bacterium]